MSVDFPRWTHAREIHAIGQTHRSAGHVRYTITDGDPLSAEVTTDYSVTIERPDAVIGHVSHGRMTCDAQDFIIEMTLEITEDGAVVLRRDWHERIPRDHV